MFTSGRLWPGSNQPDSGQEGVDAHGSSGSLSVSAERERKKQTINSSTSCCFVITSRDNFVWENEGDREK